MCAYTIKSPSCIKIAGNVLQILPYLVVLQRFEDRDRTKKNREHIVVEQKKKTKQEKKRSN
jgi:hypothetical protein